MVPLIPLGLDLDSFLMPTLGFDSGFNSGGLTDSSSSDAVSIGSTFVSGYLKRLQYRIIFFFATRGFQILSWSWLEAARS